MAGLKCPNCSQMTRHWDGSHEFCSAGCPTWNDSYSWQGDRVIDTNDENYQIYLARLTEDNE